MKKLNSSNLIMPKEKQASHVVGCDKADPPSI